MTLLFAPHSDDETLFAFYTVLRHRPGVVICFPSVRDYGSTGERLEESCAAMRMAGVEDVAMWCVADALDLEREMRDVDARLQPTRVWAPDPNASHPDHVTVATVAAAVFGDRLVAYHTYDAAGKVRLGQRVPVDAEWPELKRLALSCYRTQRQHPRARMFFDEDQFELDEYVASDAGGTQPAAAPPAQSRRPARNAPRRRRGRKFVA